MTENLNRGVPEDTGTEVAGTEVATFTGAEGAELPTGQTSVMVARPAPGETVQIESAPGQTYVLDFNPSEARAQVDSDNLILVFEDDGRVIFENLVELAQLKNGPGLQYAGEDVIALLIGQGVIPGVLDGIELIAPEPGQIIEITADFGQRYIGNFDPSSAQVTVDGDNMVLSFANGGQIIIHGLGGLTAHADAPRFVIAGTEVSSATFFEQGGNRSNEAGPDATATLETAVGGDEPVGTGATNISEDLGSTIDLLEAQDVIPPVEQDFALIDPEDLNPDDDETVAPVAPIANDDTDAVFEGAWGRHDNLGSTSGNVLTGVDPNSKFGSTWPVPLLGFPGEHTPPLLREKAACWRWLPRIGLPDRISRPGCNPGQRPRLSAPTMKPPPPFCHPRESGDLIPRDIGVPAFAGMTAARAISSRMGSFGDSEIA